MSKHTPTPWRSENRASAWRIEAEGHIGAIATVHQCLSGPYSSHRLIAQTEANKDFIVRACNSHDELVATLKECVTDENPLLRNRKYLRMRLEYITQLASAAIAKATTP